MVPAFFVSRIDANKRNEERHRAGHSTSGASGYVRDDTVLSYDVTKGDDARPSRIHGRARLILDIARAAIGVAGDGLSSRFCVVSTD